MFNIGTPPTRHIAPTEKESSEADKPPRVIVEGNRFGGSGAGFLRLGGDAELTVRNNEFHDMDHAIQVDGTADIHASSNEFRNLRTAFELGGEAETSNEDQESK